MKKILFILLLFSTVVFSQTTTTPVGSIKHNNLLELNSTADTLLVRNPKTKKLEGVSKLVLIEQVKATIAAPTVSSVIGLQDALNLKVDKVTGKSLISDTEITRLSGVTNQDLSPYETISSNNTKLGLKVDKVAGKSLISDTEITRLATVTNQDISGKANDADVIHLTGNEVKSGILTLSDGLKLPNNTTSVTATKVNVQEADGVVNTISKSDLVNVVEVNNVPSLPLIGEVGKIYVVKNLNKIYRWNGTFYSELVDISSKANDADVVHKTGNETITGVKSFQGVVPEIKLVETTNNNSVSLRSNSLGSSSFGFYGKTGKKLFSFVPGISGEAQMVIGDVNFPNDSQLLVYGGGAGANIDARGSNSADESNLDLENSDWLTNPKSIGLSTFGDNFNMGGDILGYEKKKSSVLRFSNDKSFITSLVPIKLGINNLEIGNINSTGIEAISFTKSSTPATNILLAGGSDVAQNTAFNKNFGTTAGTVVQGGTLGSNAYNSTAYLPLSGGAVNGPVSFNSTTGGAVSFQTNSLPLALMTSSRNVIGGAASTTDFNTYVYGNNPYNIWTNGVKRVTVDGSGNVNVTGTVTASPATLDTQLATLGQAKGIADFKINLTEKGANNGLATLDPSGKVPLSQLPAGSDINKGTWNASTNSPVLADGIGSAGWYYYVSAVGTQNLGSGSVSYMIGDRVNYNGSIWQRIPNYQSVSSVNGQTGIVSLSTSNISESGNLYYTESRVFTNTAVAANTAKVTNQTHTGDVTGSTALTLATVNSNVGTFGNASNSTTQTVNAKGLTTAISNVLIQIAESQVTGLVTDLANKEPSFSKNTAFNKNFGTTVGTVAEGNDSRILNGQTAFGWGNHAGKYPLYNGTGATGNWGINISGTAASASNSTLWNGFSFNGSFQPVGGGLLSYDGASSATLANLGQVQSWLGLGSNAYTSTVIPTNTNQLTNGSGYITDISGKVDKVAGKSLSDENYTLVEKNKLAGLSNFDPTTINNAVANKVDKVSGKSLILDSEITRLVTVTNQDISGKFDKTGGTISGPTLFNGLTGGTVSFQLDGAPLVLFSNSRNIIGEAGALNDFNTYVYGNNTYNVWTNETKRFEVSGLGAVKINNLSGSGDGNIVASSDGTLKRGETLGSNAYNSTVIPTNTNQLTNGAGFITVSDISNKVDKVTGKSLILDSEITRLATVVNQDISGKFDKTGGTISGNTSVTGTVTASGGFFNSDRRLKNIFKRDGDVAYYTWKDGRDNKTHIGYIAQEVQENHPNQVQVDDKGILSVNYVEILVEKIRVLEKRIEQLEKSK
ncbi:MAG: chaperone of endosialidase [Caudoviricetes sp.]|nr:MAG: chaperone of endosialidase [Caudoviricetes sp.]